MPYEYDLVELATERVDLEEIAGDSGGKGSPAGA